MSRLSTTVQLLDKIKAGDQQAINRLISIYYPILQKWAKGRMPFYHRDLVETSDLVHEALISTIKNLNNIKAERAGAFFAYIRMAVLNKIRNEISSSKVRSQNNIQYLQQSQLLHAEHIDTLIQYDQALELLAEKQREAIIMRFEFGVSFEELAVLIDKPSPDAARMYVKRSLLELSKAML